LGSPLRLLVWGGGGSREAVRDAPTRAGGDAIRKFVGDAGSTDKRCEMI